MSKLTQEQREALARELLSDDLISRQEAIDAIEHYLKHPPKNYSELFVQGMDDAYYRTLSILRAFPSAQPEQRWIPCSERPPKQNGVYAVTRIISEGFEYNNITDRCYTDCCYFDGSNTWHDDTRVNHGREYLTDVIAWQPLPEPYKEEKE